MMLKLSEIHVTQNSVRNWQRVVDMISFVESGGAFTPEHVERYHQDETTFPLVKIKRMPDGALYLHDGHHRALALYFGGREHFLPEEYTLHEWPSYESFMETNFKVGWVTPLDIRLEVRHPDIVPFKTAVLGLPVSEQATYNANNKHLYCQERNGIFTVPHLAHCVADGQCCFDPKGCACPKVE